MSKRALLAGFSLMALLGANAYADHLVAIAGPMTGQYASAGDQIRKGAEMAIADINAKGGVLGQKIKLEVGDDACDPKQAVSVANTMVNKKIVSTLRSCSSNRNCMKVIIIKLINILTVLIRSMRLALLNK